MSLLRLLSVSAFASICVMQAAGQSPAAANPAPPATTFFSPQYTFPQTSIASAPVFSAPSPFLTNTQQPAPAFHFNVPTTTPTPAPSAKNLMAKNDGCFAMRTYGFTAGDFKSGAPKPSTATKCTAAHTVTLKDAAATSSK